MKIRVPPSSAQCPSCLSTNTKAFVDIDSEKLELIGIHCSICGTVFNLNDHVLPNQIQEWVHKRVFEGQAVPDSADLLEEFGDSAEKLARKISKIMLAATQIGVNFGDLIVLALMVTEEAE